MGCHSSTFAYGRNTKKLIVNREAKRDIQRETQRFPHLETMWANYGYLLPDGTVYLAGIIPPLEGCIERNYTTSVLGGEPLGYAMQWLSEHSKQINPNLTARFAELYKGHSHHQLGLSDYTQTDVNSIVEYVGCI